MNTIPYFLFLTGLLVLNITVLYTYFLTRDIKTNETIHNAYVAPSLKQAYPLQAFTLLTGIAFLFCFSADKEWFYTSKTLYFGGLLTLFWLSGFAEGKSKLFSVLCFILEATGITGFIFLLPDFPLLTQTSLPPEAVRILIATGWFFVFKFFCRLAGRFEGLIELQSIHIGISSLLIFPESSPVSLFQTGIILLPVSLALIPFRYVFHYALPLSNGIRNFFCLLLTGLAFFTVPADSWETGAMMIGYILFEAVVTAFHFIFNIIRKKKTPLFFYENLLEKGLSKEKIIHIIVRYNLLTAGLIFFMLRIQLQFQIFVLNIFFYLKLYLKIMSPQVAKTGIIDLFKEAKKTAKDGLRETSEMFSDLKKTYSKKEKSDDEF